MSNHFIRTPALKSDFTNEVTRDEASAQKTAMQVGQDNCSNSVFVHERIRGYSLESKLEIAKAGFWHRRFVAPLAVHLAAKRALKLALKEELASPGFRRPSIWLVVGGTALALSLIGTETILAAPVFALVGIRDEFWRTAGAFSATVASAFCFELAKGKTRRGVVRFCYFVLGPGLVVVIAICRVQYYFTFELTRLGPKLADAARACGPALYAFAVLAGLGLTVVVGELCHTVLVELQALRSNRSVKRADDEILAIESEIAKANAGHADYCEIVACRQELNANYLSQGVAHQQLLQEERARNGMWGWLKRRLVGASAGLLLAASLVGCSQHNVVTYVVDDSKSPRLSLAEQTRGVVDTANHLPKDSELSVISLRTTDPLILDLPKHDEAGTGEVYEQRHKAFVDALPRRLSQWSNSITSDYLSPFRYAEERCRTDDRCTVIVVGDMHHSVMPGDPSETNEVPSLDALSLTRTHVFLGFVPTVNGLNPSASFQRRWQSELNRRGSKVVVSSFGLESLNAFLKSRFPDKPAVEVTP